RPGRGLLHAHAREPAGARRGAGMSLAVELNGVSFTYPGGPPVLSGVALEIRRGEFVTIAGPNGGGKTTLLRVALGLEQPVSGEARLFGEAGHRVREPYRIGSLAAPARTR